jgi:hypothetical protein
MANASLVVIEPDCFLEPMAMGKAFPSSPPSTLPLLEAQSPTLERRRDSWQQSPP